MSTIVDRHSFKLLKMLTEPDEGVQGEQTAEIDGPMEEQPLWDCRVNDTESNSTADSQMETPLMTG